jgi:hypothetical protein
MKGYPTPKWGTLAFWVSNIGVDICVSKVVGAFAECLQMKPLHCNSLSLLAQEKTKLAPKIGFRKNKNRVARYFLTQYTKTGENIPNYHNGLKIYQMAVKYSKFSYNIPTGSIPRPPKIFPKSGFLA